MRKILSGVLLFLLLFSASAFAAAPPQIKLTKTEWVMNHTVQSILDFTYLLMRKLDLAG